MKILYIGGAGRSGSTLLEMILGNTPGFFSIGEARHFWEYIIRGNILCGCGHEISRCEFWKSVKVELETEHKIDLNIMSSLNQSLNRTRNYPMISHRSVSGISSEWSELVRGTTALYTSIFKFNGNQEIVDSSKIPTHLYILSQIPNINPRLLHLVRDGRAVAHSWSKRAKQELAIKGKKSRMPKRSALQSMIRWMIENASIVGLKDKMPNITLRYEDFAQNPHLILEQSLNALGYSSINLHETITSLNTLQPTHSVGGNPIRFSNQNAKIVPNYEWAKSMSFVSKIVLGMVGYPILSRYDYSILPESSD